MTDNEIIKECRKKGLQNGSTIGLHSGFMDIVADRFEELLIENERLKDAFENSQKTSKYWKSKCEELVEELETAKAEIEGLEEEIEKQYEIASDTIRAEIADGGTSCHWCEDTIRGVAKADAYKEFAERLKKEALIDSGYEVLQSGTIDNLLKELVGEDNG